MVRQGARKLDDFKAMFDPFAEHPYVLDNLKQISIYTDCLGSAHWSNPSEVIEKDLAENLIFIAEVLSVGHNVTTKEIELWIKHFKYAVASDLRSQKEALVHWYYDMETNGLLPPDYSLSDIMKWLNLGLTDISPD